MISFRYKFPNSSLRSSDREIFLTLHSIFFFLTLLYLSAETPTRSEDWLIRRFKQVPLITAQHLNEAIAAKIVSSLGTFFANLKGFGLKYNIELSDPVSKTCIFCIRKVSLLALFAKVSFQDNSRTCRKK